MLLEDDIPFAGSAQRKCRNTTSITIVDMPCGTGKTTKMLGSFLEDRKYLVVTPLLSEVDRVLTYATVPFSQPDENHTDRKFGSAISLLEQGQNVVTTHVLYAELAIAAERGLLNDYEIILDEVPDVASEVGNVSADSWRMVYVDGGFAEVGHDGRCRPTAKWDEQVDRVGDTLSRRYYTLAKAGCLYLVDGKFFLWTLPPKLLQVGKSLTVYTFLAEGSMLLAYLRKLGVPFNHQKDVALDKAFRQKAATLITVRSIGVPDEFRWSYTGQTTSAGRKAREKKVAKSLANLRQRELAATPIENVMLTCSKEMWFQKGRDINSGNPKAAGFAKGSRMFSAKWVPNTTRGTNDYRHCTVAVYLWDQYMNPYIQRWLGLRGDQESQERYALTEFIQWLYRTAVRDGQPVTVYVPSERMRRLLHNWLNT
jgi:hypothetical protein